jgi:cobalamin biosynthesis protein CobT
MGRRVLNRKEMRNDFDAAERRTKDEEEVEEEGEEGDEDEEEEEGDDAGEPADGEAGADDDDDDDDDGGDDDDEDAPKKKKKKAKVVVVKAKPKARTRTPKVVRMRIVWGVFNNSNQMVASYDYAKKDEAEAHVAKLIADKRSTHFVQPVKEPIVEEKKEK